MHLELVAQNVAVILEYGVEICRYAGTALPREVRGETVDDGD